MLSRSVVAGAVALLASALGTGCAAAAVAPSAPALGTFTIQAADGKSWAYELRRHRADANVLQVAFDLAVVQLDVPARAAPTSAARPRRSSAP
jgi:hypothetical protein